MFKTLKNGLSDLNNPFPTSWPTEAAIKLPSIALSSCRRVEGKPFSISDITARAVPEPASERRTSDDPEAAGLEGDGLDRCPQQYGK